MPVGSVTRCGSFLDHFTAFSAFWGPNWQRSARCTAFCSLLLLLLLVHGELLRVWAILLHRNISLCIGNDIKHINHPTLPHQSPRPRPSAPPLSPPRSLLPSFLHHSQKPRKRVRIQSGQSGLGQVTVKLQSLTQ